MSRYDNHSLAGKNIWRKLHELADAAVMVFDEEQRLKKGKSKSVSEEEDENDQRIMFDEEQSLKKGKSKIVSEEDDQGITLFDHVPRKIMSWVRNPQQNCENPNGFSTSSTLLPHLPSFEPLEYNLAERETKAPPNPNSQSSQSSCLMEMPQRSIGSGKFKKEKVAPFPRAPGEMPEWLFQVMRDMNGSHYPTLIFERSLSKSDVNSGLSRLLIPFNMLIRNDFLTPEESLAIEREDVDEENIGVRTILVNKWSQWWDCRLKRWKMKKQSGNGTLNYALNRGWNAVVKTNGLKADDEISLWSFRCLGVLCIALEHRPKSSI